MMPQLIEQPEHRNSLGYVIAQRGIGVAPEDAMIVWGIKPDGTRLFIDRARRGAADHLTCECGAELIARKGDVRAHHLAHASGAAQSCKDAHLNALSKFAADALARFRKVRIPPIPGKREITTFAQVVPKVFDDFGGVRIAQGIGDNRRELCILFKIKRGRDLSLKERFAKSGVSAIVVDLTQFRNLPDERIADGVAFAADRAWLHNTRHPEAETSPPAKDAIRRTKSSRRTRHHQRGSPPSAQPPGIAKGEETERLPADTTSDRATPAGSINPVDWDSLSPAELLKRLFDGR